ncbi:hypothetical protein A2U01_0082129, partial [Trifolium medium]|nr:hypothetical protein [Trifolium medium]
MDCSSSSSALVSALVPTTTSTSLLDLRAMALTFGFGIVWA